LITVYRMSSTVIPYGSHPNLPHLDYRRQLEEAADDVAGLAERVAAMGLRLSLHPGQYTVINGADDGLRDRSLLEIEANAALLDALGCGPEATVVVHVGGLYGDRSSALDRWARAWDRLSDGARTRVGLENDERLFTVDDVLELHRRTGVRVVYDHHHARILPGALRGADALRAAFSTWPDGVRPKVHLSSARISVDVQRRPVPGTRRSRDVVVPPALGPHADLVSPWDFLGHSTSCSRRRPRTWRSSGFDVSWGRLLRLRPAPKSFPESSRRARAPSARARPPGPGDAPGSRE
jgi:UV DNA damage endonuclease